MHSKRDNITSLLTPYGKLSYRDLRGISLVGLNLSHADLRKADIRGSDIRKTILERADMRGTIMSEAQRLIAIERGAIVNSPEINPNNTIIPKTFSSKSQPTHKPQRTYKDDANFHINRMIMIKNMISTISESVFPIEMLQIIFTYIIQGSIGFDNMKQGVNALQQEKKRLQEVHKKEEEKKIQLLSEQVEKEKVRTNLFEKKVLSNKAYQEQNENVQIVETKIDKTIIENNGFSQHIKKEEYKSKRLVELKEYLMNLAADLNDTQFTRKDFFLNEIKGDTTTSAALKKIIQNYINVSPKTDRMIENTFGEVSFLLNDIGSCKNLIRTNISLEFYKRQKEALKNIPYNIERSAQHVKERMDFIDAWNNTKSPNIFSHVDGVLRYYYGENDFFSPFFHGHWRHHIALAKQIYYNAGWGIRCQKIDQLFCGLDEAKKTSDLNPQGTFAGLIEFTEDQLSRGQTSVDTTYDLMKLWEDGYRHNV